MALCMSVRAHGGDVHGRGGDDQSRQRYHGLFNVFHAHRSSFPKYAFRDASLISEDDNRRAKSS